MVEGTGTVAPAPVVIRISEAELLYFRCYAEERRAFRRYDRRLDAWGRGFVKDPIVVGLCGEQAVCAFLNRRLSTQLSADLSLRLAGDGGKDVCIWGASVEVKTRITSRANLYRRLSGAKRIMSMQSYYLAFARWLPQEREVHLLGWIRSSDARNAARFIPSPVADHWNLELPDERLLPMGRLVEEFMLRRAA